MVEIVIGGDVCPINRNAGTFHGGDASGLFSDLLTEFRRADLAVVNLECPLIEGGRSVAKVGPTLRAEPVGIVSLSKAHIGVVNLANNHILDYGAAGLLSTRSACARAGIAVVGVGADEREARRPIIREVGGVRVGLLAYAESEAVTAGVQTGGVSVLNLAEYVRSLRLRRNWFDSLIVLLHAGVQHYPYPSPMLQETCRFMVEEGADIVVCQHSHCPGAVEKYQKGHIVYGQGNLLFDRYPHRSGSFYHGFLVRVLLEAGLPARVELVPYHQSDQLPGARRMGAPQAERFLAEVREISARVQDVEFVREQWHQLCERKRYDLYSTLNGHGRVARFLNRRLRFSDWCFDKTRLLNLHHLISCDSHREALETLLAIDLEVRR
ncbi:CapA family protein [Geomonas anaerohicana]|uniref:CapA family protein n=1 Tax=Geomonas anaerohicana TaxID=2798583 RepID=A0ABS0YH29_9BACT|nr:CapA family protein [Geomonas anaerohicana]MBJ6751620.1 CapA family protein [Geomonas anaerohicana]